MVETRNENGFGPIWGNFDRERTNMHDLTNIAVLLPFFRHCVLIDRPAHVGNFFGHR